jgi:CheY-like chemotaxis protein
LSQVVANLLSNSARYTPAHGKVSLQAARQGDEVVIRVRDNGVGISAEMLPRVFDLFVQSPQHSDRAAGGLGLGLTLVRNLVLSHGGTVAAHSEGVGKGSEFVVRLPPLDGPAPQGRPSSVPMPLPLRQARAKVLVVDDNVDAAELLAALLARHGYVTRTASDGPAAITTAESFGPDIAILDIGLPVMDGYELAARLREPVRPRTPRLIALTGYGQEHDRARALAAGFFAHIVKPVDAELLLRTLASAEAG